PRPVEGSNDPGVPCSFSRTSSSGYEVPASKRHTLPWPGSAADAKVDMPPERPATHSTPFRVKMITSMGRTWSMRALVAFPRRYRSTGVITIHVRTRHPDEHFALD